MKSNFERLLRFTLLLHGLFGLLLFGPMLNDACAADPVRSAFTVHLADDTGAHDAAGTEWWYVTGWLSDQGHPVGFQITFFRSGIESQQDNPSAFAARHIILAHAALSDPREPHVLFAERSQREGFGLAGALHDNMDVHIREWTLARDAKTQDITGHINAAAFALDLKFHPSQPALLEGEQGTSQKGPSPQAVSAYYSLPHLDVSGSIVLHGKTLPVTGSAWLDHEWSNSYLDAKARGWDWLGANLADGGALMAFQMRAVDGSTLWSSATKRLPDGSVLYFKPDQVHFRTDRIWTSGASGVRYPVAQTVQVANDQFQLTPLMDDQEINAAASTGTLYWEGAVTLAAPGSPGGAATLGQGYLELTGYGSRLRLN